MKEELERYIWNQLSYLKSKPKLTDIEVGMMDAYRVIQNRFNLKKRIKK